jgi:hypothetical protein
MVPFSAKLNTPIQLQPPIMPSLIGHPYMMLFSAKLNTPIPYISSEGSRIALVARLRYKKKTNIRSVTLTMIVFLLKTSVSARLYRGSGIALLPARSTERLMHEFQHCRRSAWNVTRNQIHGTVRISFASEMHVYCEDFLPHFTPKLKF